MSTTPNMSLVLPTVGSTLGPAWAEELNTALELVDTHSHVPGEGVPVPTAGLNINADLSFSGYSPTDLESAVFQDVVGVPDTRSIYVDSGELYYKDGSGNAVQITAAGQVNTATGNITGLGAYVSGGARVSSASFSTLGLDFSFYYDTGKLGAMNVGDLRIYPYDGAFGTYTNFVTLKADTGMSSSYTLTLPTTTPANFALVQVSSTGSVSFSNAVSQPILEDNGTAGAPAYSFSSDTDTGMYRSSANNLTLAAAGTNALTVSGSAVTAHLPLYANTGSVSAPTIAFSSDTNTGFWLQTTDTIGVTAGGTQRLSIGSEVSTVNSNFTTGTGSITGGSINLSSGGAFKVKILSDSTNFTVAAGNTARRSMAHGLTASNIRAVLPGAVDLLTSFVQSGPLEGLAGSPYGSGAYATSTDVVVEVQNNTGASRDFTGVYAIVFYV